MTTAFTLRDFGSVVTALADGGRSVWAPCAFAFAVFAGIARIVRAFGGATSAVERIVKIRDPYHRSDAPKVKQSSISARFRHSDQ